MGISCHNTLHLQTDPLFGLTGELGGNKRSNDPLADLPQGQIRSKSDKRE